MSAVISKLIPMLEQVKGMLGVKQSGAGTQAKASQSNSGSTAAAKAKLAALVKKSKTGQSATTTIQTNKRK